jgi:hypothetical protein
LNILILNLGYKYLGNRGSSVGIATRLRAGWPRSRGSNRLPAGARVLFLLRKYAVGTGTVSPGVKRQVSAADSSPPSNEKGKNGGAMPSLPHTFSWRGV